jgi:hypothetical protein
MTSPTLRIPTLLLLLLGSTTLPFAAACDGCGTPSANRPADPSPGPTVADATVRSCDILVQMAGDEVPAVDFANNVRGQSIPQAPRLAISFAARTDEPLTKGSPFSLRFTGTASSVTLVSETCFDKTGKPVDGMPVVLP